MLTLKVRVKKWGVHECEVPLADFISEKLWDFRRRRRAMKAARQLGSLRW